MVTGTALNLNLLSLGTSEYLSIKSFLLRFMAGDNYMSLQLKFFYFFNEDSYQPGFELKHLAHFRKAASEWLGFTGNTVYLWVMFTVTWISFKSWI